MRLRDKTEIRIHITWLGVVLRPEFRVLIGVQPLSIIQLGIAGTWNGILGRVLALVSGTQIERRLKTRYAHPALRERDLLTARKHDLRIDEAILLYQCEQCCSMRRRNSHTSVACGHPELLGVIRAVDGMQGPWKQGAPSQGYQLPLTPAQLYRAGIAATNAHCRKTYGRSFDRIEDAQREEVLIGLSTAKIKFDNGLPVRVFWDTVYQTVIEGMYSDPIYGGNRNKAGWAIIGFPGIIAVHRDHVEEVIGFTSE